MADTGTIVPRTFPPTNLIQLPERIIRTPAEIKAWLVAHSPDGSGDERSASVIPPQIRAHGLFELVGRVARYRPFWIRESDDKAARRILDDPYWDTLRGILAQHDLVKIRNLPASGGASEFVHIRRKTDILMELITDPQIAAFYSEIVRLILKEEGQSCDCSSSDRGKV